MSELEQLWDQFLAMPFPRSAAGEELEGVDLVETDASIAGCISVFLSRAGALDIERTRILKASIEEVGRILPMMNTDGQRYFDHLHRVGRLVLQQLEGC